MHRQITSLPNSSIKERQRDFSAACVSSWLAEAAVAPAAAIGAAEVQPHPALLILLAQLACLCLYMPMADIDDTPEVVKQR